MVAVINFGGQYAHLIARRVRELGVKSELFPPGVPVKNLLKENPQAIIFSGSPHSAYQKTSPTIDLSVYELEIPILGICYGHQLMAIQLGGKVTSSEKKQFGKEILNITKSELFEGLKVAETVWFSHGDQVTSLPVGFKTIAKTKTANIAAMEHTTKPLFSVQFHPEVTHTEKGMRVLSNFLFNIANVEKDWNLQNKVNQIVRNLKNQIAQSKVIMAISGGVDSLVAASLIQKAIKDRLYLVFINHGLLRKNEVEEVKNIIQKSGLKNLKVIDASKKFLKALEGISDPEQKRKIIANHYFEIFEKEARIMKNVKFLGQGTIYPDRVESASTSKHSDKIKSHHNLTLPKGLKLKIIEPLAEFYKDEVRKVGKLLGIRNEFLMRHPFPGPSLSIRILGEVTQDRLEMVREADYIFIEELKRSGLYGKTAQSFAALFPIKAVGVMGDARTYSYIIALRSVNTDDFMTADWSKIPQEVLERVSSRIVNEVKGVNRVVYDITQKPPATIEYE